jgi:hypothetical protein
VFSKDVFEGKSAMLKLAFLIDKVGYNAKDGKRVR